MKSYDEYINSQFGELTVIKRVEDHIIPCGQKKAQMLCKCTCGNECIVLFSNLKRGNTKSCGCKKHDKPSKDLTGEQFGRLTVIKREFSPKGTNSKWLCKCECGNETIVSSKNLLNNLTRSCGCYQREKAAAAGKKTLTKHGQSRTRLYHIWKGMKQRCIDINASNYANYGGRGIKVCDEWLEYENFKKWALSNGYSDNLSIDRINVNGNYEPKNCSWATNEEQSNNRRCSHYIEINGEKKTVSQWAKISNLSPSTILQRINKGISGEKLLSPKGYLNYD